MLDVNKIIQNHRSIRNFLDKEIPEDTLNTILLSTQAMPSSGNAQDYSVIVVKDKLKKEKISMLAKDQKHIRDASVFLIFVADLYKTHLACEKNNTEQLLHQSIDGVITATFDAGIAMGSAIISAESLGFGITPIGGIRSNVIELAELLELPPYTFPLVGLCIGYPFNVSQKKPRMPLPAFKHEEVYQKDRLLSYINEYDEIMESYLKDINREHEINWSASIAKTYGKEGNKDLHNLLLKQRFKMGEK